MFEGKLQPPKTLKAKRTIPLGRNAVAALQAHQQRVMRTAPEDLVFGNRKGAPLRESKILTEVLQPAAVKAGLGRVTWHQFRHIHPPRSPAGATHRRRAVERELFPTVPKSPDRLTQAAPVSDVVN